jgi:hypothetical protein
MTSCNSQERKIEESPIESGAEESSGSALREYVREPLKKAKQLSAESDEQRQQLEDAANDE